MKTWVPTLWRTLNGRIILVHEMALNELNGEGRLADTFKHVSKERLEQILLLLTTSTDDYELVLP